MAITADNELKIEGAIGSLNLIRLLYSKEHPTPRIIGDRKIPRRSERVVRVVEPYEIKDGYLYAWDTTKGKTTKTFILENINNVMVLESKFKDRYPDAGTAFPTYDTTPPPDARRLRPAVNTTAFV
jgi:hypothetical protein